jgi:hypothetical protein
VDANKAAYVPLQCIGVAAYETCILGVDSWYSLELSAPYERLATGSLVPGLRLRLIEGAASLRRFMHPARDTPAVFSGPKPIATLLLSDC